MRKVSGARPGFPRASPTAASGAAGTGHRETDQGGPGPRHTPVASRLPKRPSDAFESSGTPRRRGAPGPLDSGALEDFPLQALLAAAKGRARSRLREPCIQHLEVASIDGALTLKASFHDPRLSKWYAVRVSAEGQLLWERHEPARDGERSGWSLLDDVSSLQVPLPDAFEKARREEPDTPFDLAGLRVRPGGELSWVFLCSQDFQTEPLAEVDARTGNISVLRYAPSLGVHAIER